MRLEVDRREIYRYLGLRGAKPDAATARADAEEFLAELRNIGALED